MMELPNPFSKTNKCPGREWMDGFLKRYPDLVKRKAQPIQKARVQCSSQESFTKFFDMLSKKIKELGIQNPAQVINLDETGYSSSLGSNVLAEKGTKCVSQIQGGSGKETFSVVETVAANGHLFPPLIIYKSKNLYSTWCVNGPEGAAYLSSENGWQEKKTFFFYFQKLVAWTKEWPKPILIIYDGHKSHIQCKVSKLALENNIHILSLPAHSSDKIQPLDVGVFAPVKKMWLQIKRAHGRKTSYKNITKEDFPSLMKELRQKGAFKESNIKAGFESSGIWPVNLAKALSKLPPVLDVPPPMYAVTTELPNTPGIPPPDDQPSLPVAPATDDLQPLAVTPATDDMHPLTVTPATDDMHSLTVAPTTPVTRLSSNLPYSPTYSDLSAFRKILYEVIKPRENRDKSKKKKLTFNNMALTEDDVMKQMEEEEKKTEMKEKKKEERSRKKEEAKKRKDESGTKKVKAKKLKMSNSKKKNKATKKIVDSTSEEDDDESFISDESECDLNQFLIESVDDICFDIGLNQPGTSGLNQRVEDRFKPKTNDYVAACYDKDWYIAQVIGTTDIGDPPNVSTYYHLRFTENKGLNKFSWPKKPDEVPVLLDDILCIIDPPIPVSSRHIGLEKDAHKMVIKLYYNYLNRINNV